MNPDTKDMLTFFSIVLVFNGRWLLKRLQEYMEPKRRP